MKRLLLLPVVLAAFAVLALAQDGDSLPPAG